MATKLIDTVDQTIPVDAAEVLRRLDNLLSSEAVWCQQLSFRRLDDAEGFAPRFIATTMRYAESACLVGGLELVGLLWKEKPTEIVLPLRNAWQGALDRLTSAARDRDALSVAAYNDSHSFAEVKSLIAEALDAAQ